VKIVCISDTHGQHHGLELPEGDLLLHAGDVSTRGRRSQVEDFLQWFSAQAHPHKVMIAGNHDYFFERATPAVVQEVLPSNVHYLNDSGIQLEGINIWGSPVQPWFYDWAFNRHRGDDIRKHWDLIPDNTDVLLVHGPPAHTLDQTVHRHNVGCEDLRAAVERVQPTLCVFGHIHEDYGMMVRGETQFVNASVLNVHYERVNRPISVEL